MKKELKAPIAIDENHKRYYSCERTVMLPGCVARAENFHFVAVLNNLLETIKNTPVYEQAQKVFSELSILAPSQNSYGQADTAPSRVIFLGAPATEIGDSIWNTIFTAMEKNCHIVIEYDMQTNIIKRGIRPYQLIFDNGLWDLWGYDCVNRQKQQYNLSRIKSVELRPETFELPDDYDYRNETPGTFGCYRDIGAPMTHYKIHFRKGSYAGIFARDRVWGLNSSIKYDDEGTIISFDNNQFLPILRWILGWGADVKPLEPEKLVTEWKKEIKKMYDNIL